MVIIAGSEAPYMGVTPSLTVVCPSASELSLFKTKLELPNLRKITLGGLLCYYIYKLVLIPSFLGSPL